MADKKMAIRSIWYEFEHAAEPFDALDGSADVVFELTDGSQWSAVFVTYRNIETLRRKNRLSGECLHGAYFCASDMILIEKLSKENILSVLNDLLRRNEISAYCREDRQSLPSGGALSIR